MQKKSETFFPLAQEILVRRGPRYWKMYVAHTLQMYLIPLVMWIQYLFFPCTSYLSLFPQQQRKSSFLVKQKFFWEALIQKTRLSDRANKLLTNYGYTGKRMWWLQSSPKWPENKSYFFIEIKLLQKWAYSQSAAPYSFSPLFCSANSNDHDLNFRIIES